MSSSILRRAVFEDEPLVIDNTQVFEVEVEPPPTLAENLVEELQQEHPDAEPEVIEDAVQDVIDQLMSGDVPEAPSVAESPALDVEDDTMEFDDRPPEAEGPLEPAFEVPEAAPVLITPPPSPAAGGELVQAEARRAAGETLQKARTEAAEVLVEADSRAAEIERTAYERGYKEGVTAGKAAGEEQAIQMVQQVTAIVDQATQLHDTMLREAEGEVVALCLEIARKIIQAELRTNPDVVKSVVAAGVLKINGSPRVTIRVNPDQLDLVRQHWQVAYGPNYREKEWTIEGDVQVAPGGCVLETKYGSLDAQIGSQFAEIQRTFALLLGTES